VAGQSFDPNPTGHLSQACEGKLCVLAVIRPVQAVLSRSTQTWLIILLACTTMVSISVASAPTAHASTTSTQRLGALAVAKAQYGDPYRYGAVGPNAFDCSGLTYYSFRMKGVSIPRTSEGQRTGLRKVAKADKRRGDLIIFVNSYGRAYHSSIYAGYGRIVHVSKPGTTVRRSSIWTSRYVVRRP
jgi:cell wall-associated NlpC family hydrolase